MVQALRQETPLEKYIFPPELFMVRAMLLLMLVLSVVFVVGRYTMISML
jgi:hypothetical protein